MQDSTGKITMGIDASTTSTGWSIFKGSELVAYGIVQPEGTDWRDRLIHEGPQLAKIIQKYSPEKIYLEDVPLKSGNAKALVVLGAVQGFLCGLIAQYEIPIEFLLPSEWRSPLGLYDGTRDGTKRAELKHKSILKANELFGLDLVWKSPNSKYNQDDASDAILIAYSQVKKRRFGRSKSQQ